MFLKELFAGYFQAVLNPPIYIYIYIYTHIYTHSTHIYLINIYIIYIYIYTLTYTDIKFAISIYRTRSFKIVS